LLAKSDKLVEELEAMNKRTFGMALSVHEDPSLRPQLAEEARLLRKRLLDIAEDLERIDTDTRKRWFHPISESFLDLDFVVADRGITRLRLGDIIRWGK
jgi:hypothetical protein